MKAPRLIPLLLALSVAPALAADAPTAAAPKTAATGADAGRVSYSYGYDLGNKLADLGFSDAETAQVLSGLNDAMHGKKAPFSIEQYQLQVRALIEGHLAAKTEKNKASGKAYGEKFAKEHGVKPLAGGGWYKIKRKGHGEMASPDDTVQVNYEGRLINGNVFDSSYKRGEPATFPLKGVIPCWTNGVSQLRVGGEAELVCPSDVAYGDQGHPPVIPGGSTLIFKVELLNIIKPGAAPAADGK